MTAQLKTSELATRRSMILPPEYTDRVERVKRDAQDGDTGDKEEGKIRIRWYGFVQFELDLAQNGLPAALSQIFRMMMWRAGDDLQRPVSVSGLAKDLNRTRQAISRSIKVLEDIGIVERKPGVRKPAKWRFPIYTAVVDRLRRRYNMEAL